MTLLARRYLAEYARSPLNLVLLVVVPVVFVVLTAGALAEFAELLGGEGAGIEAGTAGWAAAFLAGVAGYFQLSSAREADRRLALAGLGARRVVAARLASGVGLALLASAGALIALALRVGVEDPGRTAAATVMIALTYLAIGAVIGALVRDPVNGSVTILLVWVLDVFLSPAMSGSDAFVLRFLPTHFAGLFLVDAASGHAGPLSDLTVALAWTLGALLAAGLLFVATTRPAARRAPAALGRVTAGLVYGFREYRRNPVLWVLLAVVPAIFITLSIGVTQEGPAPVRLVEAGERRTEILSMVDLHGAVMASITIAFLAGLAGLFVVLGSAQGDRRLALAGFRAREVLAARAGVIAAATLLVTGVSLAVTAIDFAPRQWAVFAAANLLVGLTYAMIGVLVAPVTGRIGGLYVMFLLPFIDVGLAQNPMFDASPPGWAKVMPAYGATRALVDGAFTAGFDELGALLAALAWLTALAAAGLLVYQRLSEPERA